MVFSCLPIGWYGVYDKELSYDSTLDNEYKFYFQGMNNKLFHSIRFWKWVLYGGFQSVIMFAYSFYSNSNLINNQGFILDLIAQGNLLIT